MIIINIINIVWLWPNNTWIRIPANEVYLFATIANQAYFTISKESKYHFQWIITVAQAQAIWKLDIEIYQLNVYWHNEADASDQAGTIHEYITITITIDVK